MKKRSGLIVTAALLLMCLLPVRARAGIVEPSGVSGTIDRKNIHNELAASGSVTLRAGATYYLNAPIYVDSGNTIDATGATIICETSCVRNRAYKTNYQASDGIVVKGGTWLPKKSGGNKDSQFQFTHASNIRLENLDIRSTIVTAHAMEIIACKDVVIKDCNIAAVGKSPSNSHEEMIQIDVASKASAPTIGRYYELAYGKSGSFLQNNAACKNIVVDHCTITNAAKGICANQDPKTPAKKRKFHSNITVTNCHITTTNGQAIVLSNTIGATVKGNTAKCTLKNAGSTYSTAIALTMSTTPPNSVKKASYVITGNTAYGARSAMSVNVGSKKVKNLVIQKNKLYCRSGKGSALAVMGSAKKQTIRKNKTYKWK